MPPRGRNGPIHIRELGSSMMGPRTFVTTAAGALLVKAFPANAEPATKIPIICVLTPGALPTTSQFAAALTQGLREHEGAAPV
jgi:hypothetical protein